jgi:hypothetical protein
MDNQLLNWPGIIKHSGDAELTYVSDQAEWDSDADLHDFEFDEVDYLIDSNGKLFNLTKREDHYVKPEVSGHSMTLDEILALVKAHAAQKGSCCVAKLYAPTIDEAFKIVASLEET